MTLQSSDVLLKWPSISMYISKLTFFSQRWGIFGTHYEGYVRISRLKFSIKPPTIFLYSNENYKDLYLNRICFDSGVKIIRLSLYIMLQTSLKKFHLPEMVYPSIFYFSSQKQLRGPNRFRKNKFIFKLSALIFGTEM